MKLLSLHIEHFGRLADFSYVFEDPLNTILAENGWGKSTLAVFLKVMFYGFDGEMKRNEEGNERLRYRPWGGGIYGGSVTFQKGDKAYRMLRIFGARKKEDTFHLYDEETGPPSSDFSEQIGEELFGIDRESFSRTVFWSQQDHETEATTMIQAKIGDVASEQDDLTSYDRAVRQLKKEIDRLSSWKRKRRAFPALSGNFSKVSGTKKISPIHSKRSGNAGRLTQSLRPPLFLRRCRRKQIRRSRRCRPNSPPQGSGWKCCSGSGEALRRRATKSVRNICAYRDSVTVWNRMPHFPQTGRQADIAQPVYSVLQ